MLTVQVQEILEKAGLVFSLKAKVIIIKISEPIEPTNNHTAEFLALIRGLEEVAKLTTGIVSVRSDSQLVVMAVEKEFVKNEAFKEHLAIVLEIVQTFDLFFIKWIPDSENRAADALARAAIHKRRLNFGDNCQSVFFHFHKNHRMF